MSIASALNTAITGLNAANRTAQVVSSNIANALTPGYTRRQLELGSGGAGGYAGGVSVTGLARLDDPALTAQRRLSDAALGQKSRRSEALQEIAGIFGAGETGSLTDRFTQFENALIDSSARPDSETRLQKVAETAGRLAGALNAAGTRIQDARKAADDAIARDVASLNTSLGRLHDLNVRIAAMRDGTDAKAALEDQRKAEVDAISDIVPLRTLPRDNDRIAVMTTGAAILLDGRPVEIGFEPTGAVDAFAEVGGVLSGLTVNGRPVATPPGGAFAGGRLEAHFRSRDVDLPAAQEQLDALSRNLIERLSGGDADPTLAAGAPGLFTDAGTAFDPAAETGLAQRLRLNTLVDPAAGGVLWRLRDGLGAAAPGPVGDPAGLNRLIDTLSDRRPAASGNVGVGVHSAAGLFAEMSAQAQGALATAEYDLVHARARSETLAQEELALGVDTDSEMQTLLLVEQAYAANARVVQAADDMLRRILEI